MDELLTIEQVEQLPDGDYYLEAHTFIKTVDGVLTYETLYRPLKCDADIQAGHNVGSICEEHIQELYFPGAINGC